MNPFASSFVPRTTGGNGGNNGTEGTSPSFLETTMEDQFAFLWDDKATNYPNKIETQNEVVEGNNSVEEQYAFLWEEHVRIVAPSTIIIATLVSPLTASLISQYTQTTIISAIRSLLHCAIH
jgi:hypothetical protein